MDDLSTPGKRLQWARKNHGLYQSPTDAARAFGWPVSTYLGHENGDRVPGRPKAKRYAMAYGVRWDWILEGGGDPKAAASPPAWAPPPQAAPDRIYVADWRNYMGVKLATAARAIDKDADFYTYLEAYPQKLTIEQLVALGALFGINFGQFFMPPPPPAPPAPPPKKAAPTVNKRPARALSFKGKRA